MTLSRVTTFTDTTVDTSELNAEFDNIIHAFGNITVGDTDLGATTPYPYVVGSTSTALNGQITTAIAAGKYLYLPPGSYTIEPGTLAAGTRVIGAGSGLTFIYAANVDPADTYVINNVVGDMLFEDVTLIMYITGGTNLAMVNLGATSQDSIGVTFNRCVFQSYVASGRTHIQAVAGTGYEIQLTCLDCQFENAITAATCGNGVRGIWKRCKFINMYCGVLNTSGNSSKVQQDCYHQIGDKATNSYYEYCKGPTNYSGCLFEIDDTNVALTSVVNTADSDAAPFMFEWNHAELGDTGNVPAYWVYVNAGNCKLMFNTFNGEQWSGTYPFRINSFISGTAIDSENCYEMLTNFNETIKNSWISHSSSTISDRRLRVPHYCDEVTSRFRDNRQLPLMLGDVYLDIEKTATTNPNRIAFTRIDDNEYPISGATLPLTGTTQLI